MLFVMFEVVVYMLKSMLIVLNRKTGRGDKSRVTTAQRDG